MYKEDFDEPKIILVGDAEEKGRARSADAVSALSISLVTALDDETVLDCFGGLLLSEDVSLPNAG